MGNAPPYFAAIDLGTNTFKLLITSSSEPFVPVVKKEWGVFLGQGGLTKKQIMPPAIGRATEVLKLIKKEMEAFDGLKAMAVTTEAIRNAANGPQIRKTMEYHLGLKIKIIKGTQEAEYIWKGVLASGIPINENLMVIDIGGASTEVIIGHSKQVLFKQSFKTGVSKALEWIKNNPPFSEFEKSAKFSAYYKPFFLKLWPVLNQYQPTAMVGTAGSFDTWRKMVKPVTGLKANHFRFKSNELMAIINRVNSMSSEERQQEMAILDYRNETIVPAGSIIQVIQDIYTFKTVYQCNFALMEGLIYDAINN